MIRLIHSSQVPYAESGVMLRKPGINRLYTIAMVMQLAIGLAQDGVRIQRMHTEPIAQKGRPK